jgi:hypothetical protein
VCYKGPRLLFRPRGVTLFSSILLHLFFEREVGALLPFHLKREEATEIYMGI